jgi:hypothetical protein
MGFVHIGTLMMGGGIGLLKGGVLEQPDTEVTLRGFYLR